jgi:hypothetical protein
MKICIIEITINNNEMYNSCVHMECATSNVTWPHHQSWPQSKEGD